MKGVLDPHVPTSTVRTKAPVACARPRRRTGRRRSLRPRRLRAGPARRKQTATSPRSATAPARAAGSASASSRRDAAAGRASAHQGAKRQREVGDFAVRNKTCLHRPPASRSAGKFPTPPRLFQGDGGVTRAMKTDDDGSDRRVRPMVPKAQTQHQPPRRSAVPLLRERPEKNQTKTQNKIPRAVPPARLAPP